MYRLRSDAAHTWAEDVTGFPPPKMGTGECDAEAIVLKTDAVKKTEQEPELFVNILLLNANIK